VRVSGSSEQLSIVNCQFAIDNSGSNSPIRTPQSAARNPAPRWLRAALWTGGALAGFAAAIGIASYLLLGRGRRGGPLPEVEDLPVEPVAFSSADGIPLRGWFVPASEPRGVLLLCHGYLCDRRVMLPHARFLHDAGYSCLLFDFRAVGESDGNLCSLGYHERQDVLGAIRFLQEREDCGGLPLAALGLSMGAVALILAAPDAPQLRAIIADGVYPSLAQAIGRRCRLALGPFAGLASPIVSRVLHRVVGARPEEVSPLPVLAELDCPTFFIHADRDIFLDVEHAEALLAAAAEPKALWRAAGASHCAALRADPEGYARQVLDFLQTHAL
jgi:uncharacterized protein